jgi:hypothetical protein
MEPSSLAAAFWQVVAVYLISLLIIKVFACEKSSPGFLGALLPKGLSWAE